MQKFSVVTTFNEEGFQTSGKKMIESFDKFWNKDISLNMINFLLYLNKKLNISEYTRINTQ